MVKPGIKTTEFWATVLVNVAILVSTFTSSLPAKDQLIATLVVNGLYVVSRTIVKFKGALSITDVLHALAAVGTSTAAQTSANAAAAASAPTQVSVTAPGSGATVTTTVP